jgi:hypothetical protein
MNENNAAVETEAIDDSVFDEEWGDASADDDMDLSEPTEAETTEGPEDQRTEGEPAEAEKPAEAAENTEPEQQKAEGKSWKLKHNGEEVDADEAKMVELAQKGLDYDRVRGERDSFKNEHPKYADYENFLTELATNAGTDIPGLMENVRASMLMQQAEAAGKPISQETAVQQLRQREQAAKEQAEAAEQQAAQRQKANVDAFLAAYPGVKAEDVPVEILQEGFANGDLVGAYARWENKQLKAELETLKQNQKNKERSTGSRKSAGASTPKDDFDDAWDSF